MNRLAYILALTLLLCGCATGIPDGGEPMPPPDPPCDKVVIVYPERVAHCMTEAEFVKWTRRNMPGGGGW